MNKALTVFICIDWFSPAYKAGGPVQSVANMVAQFNEDNICFKIFCSNQDVDGEVLTGIQTNQWVPYNHNTDVWYCSKEQRKIKVIKAEINRIQPGVLFINGIYSWYFNLVPILFIRGPRKIISVRGMLHPGALSQKPAKKKLFLSIWKLLGLQHKAAFHVSDAAEKKYVQETFGDSVNVFIAANFPRVLVQGNLSKQSGFLKLVSLALISPMKNHLLVLEALKECTETISYSIYGPVKDAAYWQQCQEQVKKLPANITVTWHGDVMPAMVQQCLSESHVFILPSKSENFGHAIYEAFSAGKPVITSCNTPWNQLMENKAGINVDVDEPGALAKAIRFFSVMDNAKFETWSNGAVAFAKNSIDFSTIKKQYLQMFNR